MSQSRELLGIFQRLHQYPLDALLREGAIAITPKKGHNSHCEECKETIIDCFRQIYGTEGVVVRKKLDVSTFIEDYQGKPYHNDMLKILEAIESYRGYKSEEFIKAKSLYSCDLYIPSHNYIVELDENQHFTAVRKESLFAYPDNFVFGYSKYNYLDMCDEINAKDGDPYYRDEQRGGMIPSGIYFH